MEGVQVFRGLGYGSTQWARGRALVGSARAKPQKHDLRFGLPLVLMGTQLVTRRGNSITWFYKAA